jgi:predicted transcriptional regulator
MTPDDTKRPDDEYRLQITSRPWSTFKQDALAEASEFDAGERDSNTTRLNFEDPAAVQRLLTPKRLELLRSVMEGSPESIRALATRLDRNVSDVHEDVSLLAEYGVVELRENGRAKRPVVPFDSIELSVELSLPRESGDTNDSSVAP